MGIADKDYYLDANRELAKDDESAAFLLIREGQEIPAEMADKYGIGKVTPQAEEEEPAPVKAAKPSANKKAAPSANKGAK